LRVDYVAVDGLEWETPDHYQPEVADDATRRRLAAARDQDAARWAARVRTALEIVQEALDAARRPLAS
jgi:hypothetical protein